MYLTNKRLKQLIREAVTSQIKKITPLDRGQRKLHHAFQQPVIPPEGMQPDDEFKEKIATIRSAGGKESSASADSLAGALYGDDKPSFGLTRQGRPNIPFVQEPPVELDTYDYQELHKDLHKGYEDVYATEESPFLEINYPFSDVIDRHPELKNSRLNKIVDELYASNNVKDFYINIKDYIDNANYASERQKISDAFGGYREHVDLFGLPDDHYEKQGGYFKSQGSDNFEDFLLSRAERMLMDPFDFRNEPFRDALRRKQKR